MDTYTFRSKRVLAVILGDVLSRRGQELDLSMLALPLDLVSQLHGAYLNQKDIVEDGPYARIRVMLDAVEREITSMDGERLGWPEFFKMEDASFEDQMAWAPESAVALRQFFSFQEVASWSTATNRDISRMLITPGKSQIPGMAMYARGRRKAPAQPNYFAGHPVLAGKSKHFDMNVYSTLNAIELAYRVEDHNFGEWWKLTRPYYELLSDLKPTTGFKS